MWQRKAQAVERKKARLRRHRFRRHLDQLFAYLIIWGPSIKNLDCLNVHTRREQTKKSCVYHSARLRVDNSSSKTPTPPCFATANESRACECVCLPSQGSQSDGRSCPSSCVLKFWWQMLCDGCKTMTSTLVGVKKRRPPMTPHTPQDLRQEAAPGG